MRYILEVEELIPLLWDFAGRLLFYLKELP